MFYKKTPFQSFLLLKTDHEISIFQSRWSTDYLFIKFKGIPIRAGFDTNLIILDIYKVQYMPNFLKEKKSQLML